MPRGTYLENAILTEPFSFEGRYISYKYCRNGMLVEWNRKALQAQDDDSYHLESDEEDEVDDNNFDAEVEETVAKLEENFGAAERVSMELINLRLAENKSFSKCVKSIFGDILRRVGRKEKEPLKFFGYLTKWLPLLNKFNIGTKEMYRAIEVIEQYCKGNRFISLHLIVQLLFKKEFIREDIIIEWFDVRKLSTDDYDQKSIKLMEKFVEWLNEEEESDESDEDDGEDNEEQ